MSNRFRLFLVEDEDDVAFVIRKTLERAGHEVTCCRTGADALIVLSQTTFDLVLLDQELPDMKGVALLRALQGENIPAPVLMVTGHGDQNLAATVLLDGALDYIVKDSSMGFLADLPDRVKGSVTRYRLEQTNQLLAQALASASDGIFITDLRGVIIKVNEALERLSGYGRDELVGQAGFGEEALLRLTPAPHEGRDDFWKALLGRQSWQGESKAYRKDGSTFEASLTISPIVDPQGRLTHFVGILRDVTQKNLLERQLFQAQKMQSVGTLAGGVAHEFNNLLAGISGYASLALREPEVVPPVRDFLQKVVELSERAAGLTRQMLAFARKSPVLRNLLSVEVLLRDTAELVGRTTHQPVEVELAAPTRAAEEGTFFQVEGDANQLQQALVNLVLNARDALAERSPPFSEDRDACDPSGPADGGESPPPIVLRLSREARDVPYPGFPQPVPPGDYVVIEVADAGPGMSPEVLQRALDPFFTTKEVGRGTGLGLPVVFGIVQGHHGYLILDSTPGEGTRVRIYLPRAQVKPVARPDTPAPGSATLEPEPGTPHRILVVDDEQAVLDVVRRFLEIAGHEVLCAESGTEALEQPATGPPELVLLDLMMPNENVRTTFQRLRHRWPEVPVLVCTGIPEADPAPELLGQPHVSLIRKPFRMNELWYAVRRALLGASFGKEEG
jgi:two-component system cell cycle sensor histidine kinase/response regulator CckA